MNPTNGIKQNSDTTVDASELEPWYVEKPGGDIEFTAEGLRSLRGHFGRAGIDIRGIATEAQFRDAWRRAAPGLNDTLIAMARNGNMTLERRLLVAVAQGNATLADELSTRLAQRQKIGLECIYS